MVPIAPILLNANRKSELLTLPPVADTLLEKLSKVVTISDERYTPIPAGFWDKVVISPPNAPKAPAILI